MNMLTTRALFLSAAAAMTAPAAAHGNDSRPPFPLVPDPGTYFPSDGACDVMPFACTADLVARGRTQAALPVLERAAHRGSRPAARAVGLIYLRGEGDTAQDLAQAVRWFQEGAQRGDAESMYVLGVMFRRGFAVEADPASARQWLQRAAEAGYGPARATLAAMN